MLLRCVNAEGQPRLTKGALYDLLIDVEHSTRPGQTGNKTGYIVRVHDGDMAIPYLFKRTRFAEYRPGEGDDEDSGHDGDFS